MPRSRTRALAGVTAASVILSGAAAAATPQQAHAQAIQSSSLTGLLGGLTSTLTQDADLGTVVDGLVSGEELALTGVLDQLAADPDAATGDVLAPVTGLLTDLAGDPAADAGVQTLLTELVAAIEGAGGGKITDPVALGALTGVLGQLGGLEGVTALPQSLLGDLSSQLAGGDALDLAVLGEVQAVLDSLGGGALPSADLLAPVTALLGDIGDTSSLDAKVRELLTEATTLLGGVVDDAALIQITDLLDRAKSDGSTPPSLDDLLDAIVTTLRPSSRPAQPVAAPAPAPRQQPAPGAATQAEQDPNWWVPYYYAWLVSQRGKATALPAAKSRDRAKVRSLRMSKDGRKVVARLACPSSAPAACKITLSGKARGKRAARARKVTVQPGRSATRTLTLFKSARKSLRRSGGKVYTRATTRITTSRTVKFTHTRAVRIKARSSKR